MSIVIDSAEARVSPLLQFELRQIVSECVANAVRHGGATHVKVGLERGDGSLSLRVEDDGSGLSEHGVFDGARMAELGIGPKSLRERVAALGGSIRIESGAGGLRNTILLPLG